MRRELNTLIGKVSDPGKPAQIAQALSEVTQTINSLNEASEQASADVERTVEALVASLRARQKALLSDLEDLRWKKLEPLEKQRESLEEQLSAAERSVEVSQRAEECLTDEQLLEGIGWMKTKLQTAAAFTYSGPADDGYIAFRPKCAAVEQAIDAGIGCVTIEKMNTTSPTLTASTEQPVIDGSPTTIVLQTYTVGGKRSCTSLEEIGATVEISAPDESTCPVDVTPQATGTGRFDIRFTPQQAGQHKVSVKVDGQDIKGSPMSVSVQPFKPAVTQQTVENVGNFTTQTSGTQITTSGTRLKLGSPQKIELQVIGKKEKFTVTANLQVSYQGSQTAFYGSCSCGHNYCSCPSYGSVGS